MVGNAKELARIGIQTAHGQKVFDFSGTLWKDDGVPDDIGVPDADEMPAMLLSLVINTQETRLWSAAWNECTMPEMLAAFVAPDSAARSEQVQYTEDV